MKKILLAFLAITITCVALISCTDANIKKLEQEVKATDAECPINMGITGDLVSVKYQKKENRVVMFYSVNEELSRHVFLKNNKDNMRKQLRLTFSDHSAAEMIKNIVNAGASLMVVYKAPSSGKTVKIELTYNELLAIKDSPLTDNEILRMKVENSVELQNSSLPGPMTNGIQAVKVYLEDDNMVYEYIMDDKFYDITYFMNHTETLKDGIASEIRDKHNDITVRQELEAMTKLGMSYVFKYSDKEHKHTAVVTISSDEIYDIIK